MDENKVRLIDYVQPSPPQQLAIRKRICITCNVPTSLAPLQKILKLQLGTGFHHGPDLITGGIRDG
jgi:hypothetical protein